MILITGGLGYIGSHVNKLLSSRGYSTLVLDNLVSGSRAACKWGDFVECDLEDKDKLREIFETYDIGAVMHFAAFTEVADSVKHPDKYMQNNYWNTVNLLDVMREFGVGKFIFSSTAAVYGTPLSIPIKESHPLNPINPYGESKVRVEEELSKRSHEYGLRYVSLRYFNAAGDDVDKEIGEEHDPETHLIPLILDAAIGKRDCIIFGDDYPTPDGTCIRDYVHVEDLAQAHLLAYEYLKDGGCSDVFNLGHGTGFSVKQVIMECMKVTGIKFEVEIGERRVGDPSILVADSTKIKEKLGWMPVNSSLTNIVNTAWRWHLKLNFKNHHYFKD